MVEGAVLDGQVNDTRGMDLWHHFEARQGRSAIFDEIGDVVVLMSTPRMSLVNGQNLFIDGYVYVLQSPFNSETNDIMYNTGDLRLTKVIASCIFRAHCVNPARHSTRDQNLILHYLDPKIRMVCRRRAISMICKSSTHAYEGSLSS